jgi:NAD(P)-dependent dehydrogenase (short-subunit alcohol dehydrogenase family)
MNATRDPFDLSGKVALITGSSRGIGRAIAEAFAARGADVVICSRKQPACEAVAEAINARGIGHAFAIPASIGDKAELDRLVIQIRSSVGKLDILVCNAASNPYFGPLQGISDAQFQKVLNNNLLGNHWLVQRFAPDMIERGGGSIIFVGSIGGFRGSQVMGAYNVSKAADFQLARNLAVELGLHNITVNCIAPGLIRTDFARELWKNKKRLSEVLSGTPIGRIGEPEDVSGAAVFLASTAGRYVTGTTLIVDGGATITARGL